MRIINLSILFVLILTSCLQVQQIKIDKTFDLSSFSENRFLTCTALEFNEPVLRPVKLLVVDSILLLINAHTGVFVDRFNLSNLEKTGEFITFGSGPDEMIAPIGLFVNGTELSILDGGKRELSFYDVESFCLQSNPSKLKSIKFMDYIDNVLLLENNGFVGTIRSKEYKRLSFFNSQGAFQQSIGEYPFVDVLGAETAQLMSASICSMVMNDANDRICLTYMLSDIIEIYDSTGCLISRIHGPDQFLPEVSTHSGGNGIVHTKNKTRDGYFSPVVYNNEIFVLYSGKLYDPDNNDIKSNQILVFDWDGNPKRRYTLSSPIYSFTIGNGVLYGLSDNPDFHVLQCDLMSNI